MHGGNKRPDKLPEGKTPTLEQPLASSARSVGMRERLLHMQTVVGNQAVQLMLARSRPAASSASAPIQRMEDLDGSLLKTLRAMYNAIYIAHGKGLEFPKPSDRSLVKTASRAIQDASSLDEARDTLLDYVINQSSLRHHIETSKQKWKLDLTGIANSAKTKAEENEKQKKLELEALSTPTPVVPIAASSAAVGDGTTETRKRRRDEMKGNPSFLGDPENLKKVQEKLKDSKIRRLIMSASLHAHKRIVKRARKQVGVKAKHNELADEQSLGISDMLLAQQSYTRGSIGDSLKLEGGEDYQVTMSRGGGQEIQQLGPYEPNAKGTSVKQIIGQQLKGGMNTRDLSRSIETRDPKRISKLQKGKLGDKKALGKIRALRHLNAVERSRGPEVSFATTMEQRLASLGMTHLDDYATSHPLAPPQATTDLRVARDKASGGKDVDYVPQYIEDRTFTGLDNAAKLMFAKPPTEDPSLSIAFSRIAELNEDIDLEDESGAGGSLIKALELSMMSPPYVWPEDREHENEDEYTRLYNELMNPSSTTKVADTPLKDVVGSAPALLSAPGPAMPVKGLPNEGRARKVGDFKQKSDCFINTVVQLLAGPYADYFDISMHAHPDAAKRAVQAKVYELMQMARGMTVHDETGIRALRLKLLESDMVEGIVGHEDASELMFKLLYMVTDLEGVTLNLPVAPARTSTVGKDETLRDVAQREGCDLVQLQTDNVLLDASPIMMRTQSKRIISKSTDAAAANAGSAVYTGGESIGNPERGPGMLPVDMENFASFHAFMYYTFGEGATRAALDDSDIVNVIDDGQPKDVTEFFEQRRMLELPRVLTFTIRRFSQTDTGESVKNSEDFDMPKLFTMVEHSSTGKKYKKYKLTGVGYHHGVLDGGHYTADVRHSDKWYHADDEHVSEHDEVPGNLEKGYMYTYVLQSETTNKVIAMQEVDPA